MKIYHGIVMGDSVKVFVSDGAAYYPLQTHQDIRNHSPDGFNWGYGGSGPSQLALAILADHFGPAKPPETCPYCQSKMLHWKCTESECAYDGEKAGDNWKHIQGGIVHYMKFKMDVIARLTQGAPFKLDSDDIELWKEKQGVKV
jgi:hypothetical protein